MSFLDIGCPNQNMTNKIYNDYLNLDIKEKYLKKVKDKEGAEAIINSYAKLIASQIAAIKKALADDDYIKMKELVLSLRALEKHLEKTKYKADIFKIPEEIYKEYNKIIINKDEMISGKKPAVEEKRETFKFAHGQIYFTYNIFGEIAYLEEPKIEHDYYEKLSGDENMADNFKEIIRKAGANEKNNLSEGLIIGAKQRSKLLSWYQELQQALLQDKKKQEADFIADKIKKIREDINNIYGRGKNIIIS